MSVTHISNLEERFLAPMGWKTDDFFNEDTNHHLHFGYASPDTNSSKGVIVMLQGLQEFSEKYYETARFFLQKGYAFIVLEWQYQGRSGRLKSNPHKRHSDGFETDIDDLKIFVEEHVKQLFPDLPLHMLAHSTGGNIGLRYLSDYNNDFNTASLSAPLLGIYGLTNLSERFVMRLIKLLNNFPKAYVPGGGDWKASERKSDGTDKFSSDPARDAITNAWYKADPSLQGGSPTIKWLYEAYRSMDILKRKAHKITTPCLFGIAENDTIVCSKTSRDFAEKIPSAIILDLENAKHEILMETDAIRDLFLNSAISLIEKHSS